MSKIWGTKRTWKLTILRKPIFVQDSWQKHVQSIGSLSRNQSIGVGTANHQTEIFKSHGFQEYHQSQICNKINKQCRIWKFSYVIAVTVSSKYWKIPIKFPCLGRARTSPTMASHGQIPGLDEGMLWGMHLGRGEGQQLDAIAARVPWRIVSNTMRSKRHSSMLWLYIWKKHIKNDKNAKTKLRL